MPDDAVDLVVLQVPRWGQQLSGQRQVELELGQSGHLYHDLSYGVEERAYLGPDHFTLYYLKLVV